MKTILLGLIVSLAAVLAVPCVAAESSTLVRGTVTAVPNGDTLVIDSEGKPIRVRVAQIAAPGTGQPYAEESRKALASLCLDRPAYVTDIAPQGSTGPVVGTVQCLGTDIARYQVNAGWAWANPREVAKDSPLLSNQNAARQLHMGLWRDPKPVAPWLWGKKPQ